MERRFPHPVRTLSLVALAAALLWLAWAVRSVLNPLILAYLLAYAVSPLVARLERRGWSRRVAVNAIFASGFVALTLVLAAVWIQGREVARDFGRAWPRFEERLERFADEHREQLSTWLDALATTDVEGPGAERDSEAGVAPEAGGAAPSEAGDAVEEPGALAAFLERAREELLSPERVATAGRAGLQAAQGGIDWVTRLFGSALAFLTFLLLLPLYTYYLLFELERIHGFVRRYLPARGRARIERIAARVGEMLAKFLRGRLVVCFVKGAVLALGLAVLGVDYAFVLGMGAGLLSLLPFVGPLLATVAAFLLANLEHSLFGSLWRVGAVFALGEIVEGYVLVPKVLGDSLGLHPLVVLVAVFAGGALLGVFGFLVALPLTAALVILAQELLLPVLAEWADAPPEGSGDASV